jgi:hypothetical protein
MSAESLLLASICRKSTGLYVPKTLWLVYAENEVAPMCRKPIGLYVVKSDTPLISAVPASRNALVEPLWMSLRDGQIDAIKQPVQLFHPWSECRIGRWPESSRLNALVSMFLIRACPNFCVNGSDFN